MYYKHILMYCLAYHSGPVKKNLNLVVPLDLVNIRMVCHSNERLYPSIGSFCAEKFAEVLLRLTVKLGEAEVSNGQS